MSEENDQEFEATDYEMIEWVVGKNRRVAYGLSTDA